MGWFGLANVDLEPFSSEGVEDLKSILKEVVLKYNQEAGTFYNFYDSPESSGEFDIRIYDNDDHFESSNVMEDILNDVLKEFCQNSEDEHIRNIPIQVSSELEDEDHGCTHRVALFSKEGEVLEIGGAPDKVRAVCVECGESMRIITTKEGLGAHRTEVLKKDFKI